MHLTNENEIVQLNNNISNNVSSRSLRMTNLNQLVLNNRIAVWATQALKESTLIAVWATQVLK